MSGMEGEFKEEKKKEEKKKVAWRQIYEVVRVREGQTPKRLAILSDENDNVYITTEEGENKITFKLSEAEVFFVSKILNNLLERRIMQMSGGE